MNQSQVKDGRLEDVERPLSSYRSNSSAIVSSIAATCDGPQLSVRLQRYVEAWYNPVHSSKQGVVTLVLNAIVEGQDVPMCRMSPGHPALDNVPPHSLCTSMLNRAYMDMKKHHPHCAVSIFYR